MSKCCQFQPQPCLHKFGLRALFRLHTSPAKSGCWKDKVCIDHGSMASLALSCALIPDCHVRPWMRDIAATVSDNHINRRVLPLRQSGTLVNLDDAIFPFVCAFCPLEKTVGIPCGAKRIRPPVQVFDRFRPLFRPASSSKAPVLRVLCLTLQPTQSQTTKNR